MGSATRKRNTLFNEILSLSSTPRDFGKDLCDIDASQQDHRRERPGVNLKLDYKKTFLIGFGFFGTSVMWAPDRMLRPMASTSSWMALATIISGVWCSPV